MEKEITIYRVLEALYEASTLKRNDLSIKTCKHVKAVKRNRIFNLMVVDGLMDEHVVRTLKKGGRPATTYTITVKGRDKFRSLKAKMTGNLIKIKKFRS